MNESVLQEKISYQDFAKLDLRVATILAAEPVDGSSKLLKLSIRVGTEERTLAAGIAVFYSPPEQLVGKKIVVVFNLAWRKLKGIESQGMLLAASPDDDSQVKLLTVDGGAEDGWKIH
jgi:methionyl-tRNA synthetase